MTNLSGPKMKFLNKETVTFVLLEELDCSPEEVSHIVELVWRSDDLIEGIQQAWAKRQTLPEGSET